jgi:biopolymer transport protein ExbD
VSGQPSGGSGVRLDMTPMVDVAFLLLIFFMSTTTLRSAQEASVTLPTSKAGAEMPRGGRLVITVQEDGAVFFSAGEGQPEPIAPAELGGRVQAAKAALGGIADILVFADGDVPYGTMTEIMRALQEAEIFRFGLVTDLEEA